MRVSILAIGKNRQGVFKDLYEFYARRIQWEIQLVEVEVRKTLDWKKQRLNETKKLLSYVSKGSLIVVLDESGNLLTSRALSGWINNQINNGIKDVSFLIGGAHGLDLSAISSPSLVISLGRVTWPHLMIRGMISEQLYRAQQILQNHPYHKD